MTSASSGLARVSVVVPSYNQVAYLETALRSVIGQAYPATELIVVDGGSTDGSRDMIKKYESSIAKWRSHPDAGQADAISEGFAAATGDILCYLNSDDMFLPHAFREVAKVLGPRRLRPEWAIGGHVRIDAVGRVLRFDRPMRVSQRSMLLWGSGFAQPAAFWTRSLYEESGGIDRTLEFCLDYDMFLRFAGIVRPLVLRSYVAAFRDHPQSKSATIADVHVRELGEVRQRYALPTGAMSRAARALYWARWKALRVQAMAGGRPEVQSGWPRA